MHKNALIAVAREQLDAARRAPAQRSAVTLVGGHERSMRQTVVALIAGAVLDEHENPGEATLQAIVGRVVLNAGSTSWELREGDLLEIPAGLHSVEALEDSAVLLTAVPRARTSVEQG